MQAKSRFLTGHFHDAALDYSRLAQKADSVNVYTRAEALQAVAASYRAASEPSKAREALEECRRLNPRQPGIHKQIAEFQAQELDYRSAYESLRKEVEIDPKQEDDLGVRLALALGRIPTESFSIGEEVKRLLAASPQVSGLIDGLLAEYWSGFKKLSQQGREEWRTGTCDLYYFSSVEPQADPALRGRGKTSCKSSRDRASFACVRALS